MESFESDLLFELAKFMSIKDILAVATANLEFQKKFLDPRMNEALAIELGFPFGLSLNELKVYESKSLNGRLLSACVMKDMRLIRRLIELGANNFDECMIQASRLGHIKIIKFMIYEGATDFKEAIAQAIMNNHVKIVELLYDRVDNFEEIDLDELGIFEAAENGNKDVIEFLQSKDYVIHNVSILDSAAYGGHLDLVKYMVSLGTPISDIALENGIQSGNIELVKYFVEQGENDFNYILDVAAEYGHVEIAKYAIERGAANVNEALWDCINNGTEYKEIIRLLIQYATDKEAIKAARDEL